MSNTFILGAGFPHFQGYPLGNELKKQVIDFSKKSRHNKSNDDVFIKCFESGLKKIDPDGALSFDQLIRKLDSYLRNAEEKCCRRIRNVLEKGCAKLFWKIFEVGKIENIYANFGTHLENSNDISNSVISYNWDLLVEKSLNENKISWSYSNAKAFDIPIIKPHGSINWTQHKNKGSKNREYQFEPVIPDCQFVYDPENHNNHFCNFLEQNPQFHFLILPGEGELDKNSDIQIFNEKFEECKYSKPINACK